MYVALAGVDAEFEPVAGGETVVLRSSPRGVFRGDLLQGTYRVTLGEAGLWVEALRRRIGRRAGLVPLAPGQTHGLHVAQVGTERRILAVPRAWRGAVSPFAVAIRFEEGIHRVISWIDEHGPQANRQILPDGDFTQTGVKWNGDGYPAPPVIRAPERSGLYYIHARTPSNDFFSFPWVVAPAKPTASIAVLASTNTWNAYNNYGGRSNYINANRLPDTPVVNARQDLDRYYDKTAFGTWKHRDEDFSPLSFDRPEPNNHMFDDPEVTDPVQGRVQCGQAPGEWRLYGWLEREGFAYDLYAEAHLHEGKLPLDAYKVLIIAVHPEYWTREMYLAVKAWVFERGGRLMYLGRQWIELRGGLRRGWDDAVPVALAKLAWGIGWHFGGWLYEI
jgi:hypothetical protein